MVRVYPSIVTITPVLVIKCHDGGGDAIDDDGRDMMGTEVKR